MQASHLSFAILINQYNYDLNGNMILDSLNGNYDIKYDHRNLITELYHKESSSVTRPNTYSSRYYFDESGNRVKKLVYFNSQTNPPPVTDWINPGNGWALSNNEFYVKGVDGKDLATYEGNNLNEWYVWANDIAGKIKNDIAYYYYKDHLGSVRAVVKENGAIVAGYDYDAWGYPLENRNYNGDSIKYKYTGKELDKESFYDYFGARYYDSRIGRWGQVDPMADKSPSLTPFQFAKLNPLYYIDPNGAFELPEKYVSKYPKLAAFLQFEIPKLSKNPTIMSALVKNTGLSEEELRNGILMWGKGPKVIVENIGRNSAGFERFGTHVVGSIEIKINEKWVDQFVNSDGEQSDIARFLVGVTILHEGVHVGVEFGGDNIDFSKVYDLEELGSSFEFDAYGRVINNYNDAVDVLNEFNKNNNITKRYSKIE